MSGAACPSPLQFSLHAGSQWYRFYCTPSFPEPQCRCASLGSALSPSGGGRKGARFCGGSRQWTRLRCRTSFSLRPRNTSMRRAIARGPGPVRDCFAETGAAAENHFRAERTCKVHCSAGSQTNWGLRANVRFTRTGKPPKDTSAFLRPARSWRGFSVYGFGARHKCGRGFCSRSLLSSFSACRSLTSCTRGGFVATPKAVVRQACRSARASFRL